jgi:hypothetical protein
MKKKRQRLAKSVPRSTLLFSSFTENWIPRFRSLNSRRWGQANIEEIALRINLLLQPSPLAIPDNFFLTKPMYRHLASQEMNWIEVAVETDRLIVFTREIDYYSMERIRRKLAKDIVGPFSSDEAKFIAMRIDSFAKAPIAAGWPAKMATTYRSGMLARWGADEKQLDDAISDISCSDSSAAALRSEYLSSRDVRQKILGEALKIADRRGEDDLRFMEIVNGAAAAYVGRSDLDGVLGLKSC